MTVIAVAGGTGGVGKTIVERLAQEHKLQVVVLSRGTSHEDSQIVPHVQIDYQDIPSMIKKLEHHNIQTIISTIGLISDETSQSQLNLIEAAEQSHSTQRFIPSEFSFIQTEDLLPIDPSIRYWLDAANKLKSSRLKYTRVIPGFFMDYWGMPHVQTNLQPYTFGIDIGSGVAAIPGDGNDVICMTYTYDMVEYMVKLLGTEEWDEFTVIVGDEVTYNQVLAMAEDIRGMKFHVTYDSIDRIQAGDVTIPPMPRGTEYPVDEVKEVTALVSRLTVNGVFDLPKANRLNERFPEIKPTKMKDFLEIWRN